MIKEIYEVLKYVVACFILFEVIVLFLAADVYFISLAIEKIQDWLTDKRLGKKGRIIL